MNKLQLFKRVRSRQSEKENVILFAVDLIVVALQLYAM